MTEEEEFWKADPRLLTKRKTSPFEPTPSEEKQGETGWKKFTGAVVARVRHH